MDDPSVVAERGVLTAPVEVWQLAVRRAEVIGRLAGGDAVGHTAADMAAGELGISRRQVYELLRRWRAGSGVVSDLAGSASTPPAPGRTTANPTGPYRPCSPPNGTPPKRSTGPRSATSCHRCCTRRPPPRQGFATSPPASAPPPDRRPPDQQGCPEDGDPWTIHAMTYTPPPLPETFEVTQGRRMVAAHDVGDHVEVERVRHHLVTEGSTDAADAAQLDDLTQAMLLVKQMVDAGTVGNAARAEELGRQVNARFGKDMVDTIRKGMLFAAGREQGWLPEATYDELVAFTTEMDPEITAIVRQIRRGRPQ